jgi:hypothetical protein
MRSRSRMPLADRLRIHLRAFTREQVDQFVEFTEVTLRLAQIAPQRPTDGERLTRLARAEKAGANFKKSLIAIVSTISRYRPVGPDVAALARARRTRIKPRTEDEDDELHMAWIGAIQAVSCFQEMVRKEINRFELAERRGRRRADAEGILLEIAQHYFDCFAEMPTTTSGGPFSNVVVEIAGQKNVERRVRAAVSALRERLKNRVTK